MSEINDNNSRRLIDTCTGVYTIYIYIYIVSKTETRIAPFRMPPPFICLDRSLCIPIGWMILYI